MEENISYIIIGIGDEADFKVARERKGKDNLSCSACPRYRCQNERCHYQICRCPSTRKLKIIIKGIVKFQDISINLK